MTLTIETITNAIIDGNLDGDLDTLTGLISTRREIQTMKRAATFKVGDKVKFVSGRPKYLIGLTATIVRKKQKNFEIKFDEGQATGKYRGNVTCPPSLLEKVQKSDQ